MKENMKNVIKGAAIAVTGLGVAVAGTGLGFVLDNPDTIVERVPYPVEKIVEVEVLKEVPVPYDVITEVIIEDTDFLEKVCDRMMFDDILECKEEINSEDEALKLALELFDDEEEIFDLLDDEGFISDEDEAKIIRVYDDFDDIEILESDFDDSEYLFKIRVKVEDLDEDVKNYLMFEVEVEDGSADIKEIYEDD